jgi:hypothetical protein
LQFSSRTVIQWEWREGSRQIRLLEPFTHLHPHFQALWGDPRFIEPITTVRLKVEQCQLVGRGR